MAFVIKSGFNASIAAGAGWSVQPPVGEQWVITAVATSAIDNGDLVIYLYNGAASASVTTHVAPVNNLATNNANMKIFINNTIYLNIHNRTAAAVTGAYTGVLL